MATQENKQSSKNPSKQPLNQPQDPKNSQSSSSTTSIMLSPRFKSVAELAGWDEEALLLASLVVEDTPERDLPDKKRSVFRIKSPPTNSSRRKRRARRPSPASLAIAVFNLDDEDPANDVGKGHQEKAKPQTSPKNPDRQEERPEQQTAAAACSSSSTLPCMDRLREELSCAICLEICFEPSTTACGHSFCKKCLRSAAEKCGKRCPKCRQLISNGRSCTINTVLWNTIQLLFPAEVEARAAAALNSREAERQSPPDSITQTTSNLHVTRRLRRMGSIREDASSRGRREDTSSRGVSDITRNRRVPSQDEDAAIALRLQREEFMEIYRGSSVARDNLRAMAQRAINNRVRHRAV